MLTVDLLSLLMIYTDVFIVLSWRPFCLYIVLWGTRSTKENQRVKFNIKSTLIQQKRNTLAPQIAKATLGESRVYCDSNSTYPELLIRAKLPTLYNRRLQDIAILMYKVKNGLCPDYIYRLFISRSNQYNLRNNDFQEPIRWAVAIF